MATVRSDIHDIGKNIVKMTLENYGYEVVAWGRRRCQSGADAHARDARTSVGIVREVWGSAFRKIS
ncbi:MAG: hypothetical protein IJ189_06980 [Clostridia bacterium]|nr:hypothetical protein [Clostridia bacterium]